MTLTVGDNQKIDRRVNISHTDERPVVIGSNAKIFRGAEIVGPVTIGNRVFINRDGYIRPHTTIGDNVAIGPFVRLITDTHEIGPSHKRAGKLRFEPIAVGAGTWIGASVTVLSGVTIGKGCMIAAGSVVTADVADDTMVGGVPARFIKSLPP